ncbi:MAG: PD-(D/E)XK nuclease family protein, partial [Bacteroidales bacterium]|nr:PD-(D/E)XK nuclease family protein [Bacteroidales bacterium]
SREERVLKVLSHMKNIDSLKLPSLNMEFYQTYGEYNETREVLRTIIKEGYPCDEVQIFYTTQEPYSQYFYQLSLLYQIPMTFHSGISIKNSHPAQFLFSLLDWIYDNYSIVKLITLLKYSSININSRDSLIFKKFVSLLRESPIGWGRERYLPGLDLSIEEKKIKMENTSQEKARECSEDIQYLLAIKEWIKELFAEIPVPKPEDRIALSELVSGILNLVKKYALKDESSIDEEAALIIGQRLGTIGEDISSEFHISEALLLIKNLIEQERINCSSPLPGHLHIASYKKGIWVGRYYTFLVGMDYHKFPGSSDEDTMLLETEKGPFKHLSNNNEKNRMEQLRLLRLILSQMGKKYLSYSCYDTVAQREQAPANLLFQLYRLQKKDVNLDYVSFYQDLSPIRNFIPQNSTEVLDEGEYFLYFGKKKKIDLQPLFSLQYDSFQEGVRADRVRREEGFNIYNGNIKVNTAITDPRENRGIVVSASKLERIAYCPYLYFLQHVLKIRPPKEMAYDPAIWLNPMERGLLLHEIYEKFYQALLNNLRGRKIKPSYSQHWSILEEVTEESLSEKKRHLAPPSELVYEAEKREILESNQIFLKAEEEIYKEYSNQPRYFELAFGTRDSEHGVLGKIRAVELRLPNGSSISVQGKMDRVDILPDGTYLVIDYKTGSSREYKKNTPFRYGQQVQHALYDIAWESIIAKRKNGLLPKVKESGYYFPTVNGQGNLVLYKQQNRELVLEIINILLDIVREGNFSMVQSADDLLCKDYKDIMEQNEVIVLKGEKGEKYDNEPALEDIRRLQQFE